MGKLEILGFVLALGAVIGAQATDKPAEGGLIVTTEALMGMTHSQFESWCRDQAARVSSEFDATKRGKATCAWLDAQTGRVWHAAVHFDGRSKTPAKADTGLLDASNAKLIRLVQNEFGMQDTRTGEGFLVWDVELDGRPGRLTVAPFEDLTIIRMARTEEPAVLSMR